MNKCDECIHQDNGFGNGEFYCIAYQKFFTESKLVCALFDEGNISQIV